MRYISFSDEEGKNTIVEIRPFKKDHDDHIPSYKEKQYERQRYIKSTLKTDYNTLCAECNFDDNYVAQKLITEDPDIDFKLEGMRAPALKKVFVTQDNKISYNVHFEEQIFNADETLREKRPFIKTEANVQNNNLPLRMSGLTIPIKEAVRRYIFCQNFQLVHTDGLTFDFLYGIAKRLSEKKEMMYVGTGVDGKEPIILTNGGKKYRGFIKGDVDYFYGWSPNNYTLTLHLTEIDLHSLDNRG